MNIIAGKSYWAEIDIGDQAFISSSIIYDSTLPIDLTIPCETDTDC